MREQFIKTDAQRQFYKAIEELTDKELQEKQAFYQLEIKIKTEKIYNNIQFFFWVTIISAVLMIFVLNLK